MAVVGVSDGSSAISDLRHAGFREVSDVAGLEVVSRSDLFERTD
jgi:hypothetical protein